MQTSLVFTNTSKSVQSWRLLFDGKLHSDFQLEPTESTPDPVYVLPTDTTVAISVTTGTTTVRAELEWDGDKFVLVPVPVPIWNLVIDTKAGTDAYATQCSLGPE